MSPHERSISPARSKASRALNDPRRRRELVVQPFLEKKFWEGETEAQLARRRQVRAKDPLAAATD